MQSSIHAEYHILHANCLSLVAHAFVFEIIVFTWASQVNGVALRNSYCPIIVRIPDAERLLSIAFQEQRLRLFKITAFVFYRNRTADTWKLLSHNRYKLLKIRRKNAPTSCEIMKNDMYQRWLGSRSPKRYIREMELLPT